MLYLTNVNVNTPLIKFYGFCKVIVEKKACPDICRVDLFRTCTDEPNSTTLSDVKCCSLVIVYLYIPVAGFDTKVYWYLCFYGTSFICILSSRRQVTNHAKDWISCPLI